MSCIYLVDRILHLILAWNPSEKNIASENTKHETSSETETLLHPLISTPSKNRHDIYVQSLNPNIVPESPEVQQILQQNSISPIEPRSRDPVESDDSGEAPNRIFTDSGLERILQFNEQARLRVLTLIQQIKDENDPNDNSSTNATAGSSNCDLMPFDLPTINEESEENDSSDRII